MITIFNNPKDVAITITDFVNPLQNMASEMPTTSGVRASIEMFPELQFPNESGEEATERKERNTEQAKAVRDFMRAEMKIFTDRRKTVTNNLTTL